VYGVGCRVFDHPFSQKFPKGAGGAWTGASQPEKTREKIKNATYKKQETEKAWRYNNPKTPNKKIENGE